MVSDQQLLLFLDLFDNDRSGSLEYKEIDEMVYVRDYYHTKKSEVLFRSLI